MSITYGTALQNEIALLLGQSLYSDLTTAQKTAIDGASATSPPTAGAAGRASDVLIQWANAYTTSDLTFASIPDLWGGWFALETAASALPAFVSADGSEVRKSAQSARANALASYASVAFNSATAGLVGQLTVQSLRAYAITAAIRARDSVVIDVPLIDSAIEEVITEIWNSADWTFKTAEADLTISTSGAVTVGGSLSLDKLVGNRILYTGDDGGFAANVDRKTILDYTASETSNGKPLFFHLKHDPDDLDWTFDRTPDREYTAKAYFTIQTPSMMDMASMNAALAVFPTDFRSIIKNRVLGLALKYVGRVTVPAQIVADTSEQIRGLLPRYDKTSSEAESSRYTEYDRPFGMGNSGGFIGGGGL